MNIVKPTGISSEDSSFSDQNEMKQKLALAYKSNLDENLKAEVLTVNEHVNDDSENMKPERWTTTWLQQVTILLRRGVKERRHEFFSTIKIGQVIAVSFLTGLLWWQSETSHLQDQVYHFISLILTQHTLQEHLVTRKRVS